MDRIVNAELKIKYETYMTLPYPDIIQANYRKLLNIFSTMAFVKLAKTIRRVRRIILIRNYHHKLQVFIGIFEIAVGVFCGIQFLFKQGGALGPGYHELRNTLYIVHSCM